VLRVKGNLYQSASGVITETANGTPFLELNGRTKQEITMAGLILNQVGFRLNNVEGAELLLPLKLPWNFNLAEGILVSTWAALLTLDTVSIVMADSSRLSGSYVDGPMCKLGLSKADHFLFPVGKAGYLRWLNLHSVSGDFTVEYFRSDPSLLGTNIDPALNHISKLEYWTVQSNSTVDTNAIIELSFASVQCGGVTDPQFLNVARFAGGLWEDAGHTAITGNAVQGSVSSNPEDFTAKAYTLASTVSLENPLPITTIDLSIKKVSEKIIFNWMIDGPEVPERFEVVELADSVSKKISEVRAIPLQTDYSWVCSSELSTGSHFFRIDMVDDHGLKFKSNIVPFEIQGSDIRLFWVGSGVGTAGNLLVTNVNYPDQWNYEILSINGNRVVLGTIQVTAGNHFIQVMPKGLSAGLYVFHAAASNGKTYSLLISKSWD
jgi:hypothetical protein